MSQREPLVSVIMPVYNAEAFVAKSIASILGQTHANLQLIIVNDGSTDGSDAVIRSFTDERIIYLRQTNAGVAVALNTALASATGSFIARQDADDVSLPERIAEQVALFAHEPHVVIAGTWARIIDQQGTDTGRKHEHPTGDTAIRYALLFDSPFVSSSVMFRTSMLEKVERFSSDPSVFEDYDMWSRIAQHGQCANLPEVLLEYREVKTSLSHTTENWKARIIEQRRRALRQWMRKNDHERTIDLAANIGFAHHLVTGNELRAVHALLLRGIAGCTANRTEQRPLRADLHGRMLSFHLMRRSNVLAKAVDRIRKEWVLATTNIKVE